MIFTATLLWILQTANGPFTSVEILPSYTSCCIISPNLEVNLHFAFMLIMEIKMEADFGFVC